MSQVKKVSLGGKDWGTLFLRGLLAAACMKFPTKFLSICVSAVFTRGLVGLQSADAAVYMCVCIGCCIGG